MKYLITGGNGFIGQALIKTLVGDKHAIVASVRNKEASIHAPVDKIFINEIGPNSDWSACLYEIDTVIHLAGRAHVMHETNKDPISAFRSINTFGTINLARQAVAAGVKRFVFISTIKVNGESTLPGQSFKADDISAPVDPYGQSKLEAELGLLELARDSGIEVVILRPPLVYGPGVKGNFLALANLVEKKIPLPLGSISNSRSMIALSNIVDLIILCTKHPAAVNQVFLASDGKDVSTTLLLCELGKALNKSAVLFPIPEKILLSFGSVLGLDATVKRLVGNLQVDIEKTRKLLGWQPPVSMETELARFACAYSTRNIRFGK